MKFIIISSILLLLCVFSLCVTSFISAAEAGVDIVDIAWNFWGAGKVGKSGATKAMQDACSTSQLKLVRFAATPFWPIEFQKLYFSSPAAEADYWNNVEQLLLTAQRFGCKLIPSLFWNFHAVPDLFKEHLGEAMRDPSSKSRAFWKNYTQTLIRRFTATKNESSSSSFSSVFHAWELGNELNLLADLNQSGSTNMCAPSLGTPTHRTLADNFSTSDMIEFETWLVSVIAEVDPFHLPVSTGHSTPRTDAWHLRQSYFSPRRDWTADTEEQFQISLLDQSSCCDYVSMHFYPGAGDRWGHSINSTYPIQLAAQTLKLNTTNKTLYVGEFGNKNPGPRVFSHDMLATLGQIQTNAVLPKDRIKTTIWVWEFYQRSATEAAPFSLIPGRDDAMIRALEQFNQKYN